MPTAEEIEIFEKVVGTIEEFDENSLVPYNVYFHPELHEVVCDDLECLGCRGTPDHVVDLKHEGIHYRWLATKDGKTVDGTFQKMRIENGH